MIEADINEISAKLSTPTRYIFPVESNAVNTCTLGLDVFEDMHDIMSMLFSCTCLLMKFSSLVYHSMSGVDEMSISWSGLSHACIPSAARIMASTMLTEVHFIQIRIGCGILCQR